jgi:hypothetical protein
MMTSPQRSLLERSSMLRNAEQTLWYFTRFQSLEDHCTD